MKSSTLRTSTKPMKRSAMKSYRPKVTPIRRSAKGEECTIELAGICNHNPETVVWCHENSYSAGKGMGMKARDERGAYGCSTCHAVYDGQAPRLSWMTKEYVDQRFQIAMDISREILRRKGLLP